MLVAAMAALAGCDSFIYDDEGDCAPHYRVRFKYDMNMKYADAFPAEVNSVTLYAVDPATGNVVWSKHESGEQLNSHGYYMELPLDPGDYTLMAWCGDGHRTSFTVNEHNHIDQLHCRLNRLTDAQGTDYIDADLGRLYHGREESVTLPDRQGTHECTVSLTKDTNVIRVILQQLSGERMDKDDWDFVITDNNGHLESDNTLRDDTPVQYRPWAQHNSVAGVVFPNPDEVEASMGAVMAEITVSRLMADGNPRLTVSKRATGETVFSVPLKPYCLAFKGDHYKDMTDQEFLDREDHYNMVFFLDEGMRWMNTYIYINSFKVVLQNVEL